MLAARHLRVRAFEGGLVGGDDELVLLRTVQHAQRDRDRHLLDVLDCVLLSCISTHVLLLSSSADMPKVEMPPLADTLSVRECALLLVILVLHEDAEAEREHAGS